MKKYLLLSPIIFGIAGAISLFITDIIVVPGIPGSPSRFYFFKEPMYFISATIIPALFAYISSYRWLIKKRKKNYSWLYVSLFSWFSLVINPIVWMLVLSSFLIFGITAFLIFGLTGIILKITLGNTAKQLESGRG